MSLPLTEAYITLPSTTSKFLITACRVLPTFVYGMMSSLPGLVPVKK